MAFYCAIFSYGLLGASGCGKTTLLSCIVGRRRLNSGEIWVLGGHPGSPGSGVPGPRIGYMPQELALYGEFTLQETLIYFGWIAGMTTAEVDEKIEFFIKLLQLPSITRFVKSLSGGQQRRMSLAAALIHGKYIEHSICSRLRAITSFTYRMYICRARVADSGRTHRWCWSRVASEYLGSFGKHYQRWQENRDHYNTLHRRDATSACGMCTSSLITECRSVLISSSVFFSDWFDARR